MLTNDIREYAQNFEATYSRFRETSLIARIAQETGTLRVPRDLVTMLKLYEQIHDASDGAFTPLIGRTMESIGYDREYSLRAKDIIQKAPPLSSTLRIIDAEHIKLLTPVLIDLGAMGKGYSVDRIAEILRRHNCTRYLVDGSGDIVYRGEGTPLRCGLEDPENPQNVIGVTTVTDGAFCASGIGRRSWGTHHHIVDARTNVSPMEITGTWVKASTADLADALATCLFLVEPERLQRRFAFEYCTMSRDRSVRYSAHFDAEFF